MEQSKNFEQHLKGENYIWFCPKQFGWVQNRDTMPKKSKDFHFIKDKSGLLNFNSPQVIQQSFVSGNWCKILKSGLILVVYGWTNIVMSNFLQKSPKVVEIKNIL